MVMGYGVSHARLARNLQQHRLRGRHLVEVHAVHHHLARGALQPKAAPHAESRGVPPRLAPLFAVAGSTPHACWLYLTGVEQLAEPKSWQCSRQDTACVA